MIVVNIDLTISESLDICNCIARVLFDWFCIETFQLWVLSIGSRRSSLIIFVPDKADCHSQNVVFMFTNYLV